jgi:hypothetical protein
MSTNGGPRLATAGYRDVGVLRRLAQLIMNSATAVMVA